MFPKIITGAELKVGDTIEVWWTGRRDTITALRPYTGPIAGVFTKGAQLATFAVCQGGMTINNGELYTLIARMEPDLVGAR